jgi:predicted chitinase
MKISEVTQPLNEGWKENLYKIAVMASLGVTGSMGYVGYKNIPSKPEPIISGPNNIPKQQIEPVNNFVQNDNIANIRPKARPEEKSELAPSNSIRPVPAPSLKNPRHDIKYLIDLAVANGIKGIELAAFLAQTSVESNNFNDYTEQGSESYFNKYDIKHNPRMAKILGNTNPGDGFTYRGRGQMQLTGKYNYMKAGKALGIDLINNPDLAADPKIGARIAVWYWITRVKRKVSNFEDVVSVTSQINSGLDSLDKRELEFKKFVNVLRRDEQI